MSAVLVWSIIIAIEIPLLLNKLFVDRLDLPHTEYFTPGVTVCVYLAMLLGSKIACPPRRAKIDVEERVVEAEERVVEAEEHVPTLPDPPAPGRGPMSPPPPPPLPASSPERASSRASCAGMSNDLMAAIHASSVKSLKKTPLPPPPAPSPPMRSGSLAAPPPAPPPPSPRAAAGGEPDFLAQIRAGTTLRSAGDRRSVGDSDSPARAAASDEPDLLSQIRAGTTLRSPAASPVVPPLADDTDDCKYPNCDPLFCPTQKSQIQCRLDRHRSLVEPETDKDDSSSSSSSSSGWSE